jgi:hypothetical protein
MPCHDQGAQKCQQAKIMISGDSQMSDMALLLGRSTFTVGTRALRLTSSLLMEDPGLESKGIYRVQTTVRSPETFEGFLRALETGSDLSVTPDNFMELSLLCEEFGAEKLRGTFDQVVRPAIDFGLEARAFEAEGKVAFLAKEVGLLRRDCARTAKLEVEFAKLRGEFDALKESTEAEIGKLKSETAKVGKSVSGLETLRPEFDEVKRALERLQQDVARVESNSTELDKAFRTWVPKLLSFPMKEVEPVDPSWNWEKTTAIKKENDAESLDGIISYLTKKHGGNVQEKGIVTMTSKSDWNDPDYALKNVADLTSDSRFYSKNKPGQWVCWDFREIRVRPTHYTIWALWLKSWVVDGSLDGSSWTEIDRKTGSENPYALFGNIASFAVSQTAEFRFIRLTQTDKAYSCDDLLRLYAVEFFGTLSE